MKTTLTILSVILCSYLSTASDPNKVQITYDVNKSESSIKWTGYHIAKSYEHWGNVKIKSGKVEVSGGEVTGGSITIDMKSISCGDVSENEKNKKLVNHLKSDAFFNVKKFSTAQLEIKKSTLSESGGSTVSADITIRGITQPISFELISDENDDQLILTAELVIDRSKHEVLYGWSLDNVIISEDFKLEVKLVLDK